MIPPRHFPVWAALVAILSCLFGLFGLFGPAASRAQAPAAGTDPAITALERAGLVEVVALAPGVRLDMRYATSRNFIGRAVYPSGRCFLRREAAERLAAVQAELAAQGLGLVLYDCYRPFSVQKTFWELTPDRRYVGRPVEKNGTPVSGSKHNRGMAVDLGLTDARGEILPMPTDFDDFTPRAARSFTGGDPRAVANSRLLEAVMTRHGFSPIATEWWHFDANGWKACPLLDVPLPAGG